MVRGRMPFLGSEIWCKDTAFFWFVQINFYFFCEKSILQLQSSKTGILTPARINRPVLESQGTLTKKEMAL